MNPRIRELAEQAGINIDSFQFSGTPIKHIVDEPSLEKFAELIVCECVTRLEQHHPFTKDPEAYLYAISLIEEHFGVDE